MLNDWSPVWGVGITAICFVAAWPVSRMPFFAALDGGGSGRFGEIDGLRGYLAFAVLLTHIVSAHGWYMTGIWTSPPSAFYQLCALVPVSLFFIITAFLFWSKVNRSSGRLDTKDYLESRVRRLGPLYWSALAVLFIIVGLKTGWRLHDSPLRIVVSAFRWLVFGIAGRPDLNGLKQTFLINPPLWTLQYEWLFYIALPFLARFSTPLLTAPLILGLFAVEWLLPGRAAVVVVNFGFGMAAAHLHARYPVIRWLKSRVAAAAAIGLVSLAAFVRHDNYSLLISALAAPVFICALYGNTFFGLTSNPAARTMGLISYSVYVVHCLILLPTLHAVDRLNPVAALPIAEYWAIGLVVGLATVLVSAATFRFIEHPGMTRATRRPTAGAAVAG